MLSLVNSCENPYFLHSCDSNFPFISLSFHSLSKHSFSTQKTALSFAKRKARRNSVHSQLKHLKNLLHVLESNDAKKRSNEKKAFRNHFAEPPGRQASGKHNGSMSCKQHSIAHIACLEFDYRFYRFPTFENRQKFFSLAFFFSLLLFFKENEQQQNHNFVIGRISIVSNSFTIISISISMIVRRRLLCLFPSCAMSFPSLCIVSLPQAPLLDVNHRRLYEFRLYDQATDTRCVTNTPSLAVPNYNRIYRSFYNGNGVVYAVLFIATTYLPYFHQFFSSLACSHRPAAVVVVVVAAAVFDYRLAFKLDPLCVCDWCPLMYLCMNRCMPVTVCVYVCVYLCVNAIVCALLLLVSRVFAQ